MNTGLTHARQTLDHQAMFPVHKEANFSFVFFFVLCNSPGWPGIYFVDQIGFKFIEMHLLLPPKCSDQRSVAPLPGKANFYLFIFMCIGILCVYVCVRVL